MFLFIIYNEILYSYQSFVDFFCVLICFAHVQCMLHFVDDVNSSFFVYFMYLLTRLHYDYIECIEQILLKKKHIKNNLK